MKILEEIESEKYISVETYRKNENTKTPIAIAITAAGNMALRFNFE